MILYNASSSYYSMIGRYALLEAQIPFDNKRMDIHLAKEQLSTWYMKINPALTVPSLVDNELILTSSEAILSFAASKASTQWMDADPSCAQSIEQVVKAHYAIMIERLTFCKALKSIPPLRYFVPKMLHSAINTLEKERATTSNLAALEAKIQVNQARLTYFTTGSLLDKLEVERNTILHFLSSLPKPQTFLFGDKPSSADVVVVVLLGRLKMIGEYSLVQSPNLQEWFSRMQSRTTYKEADIWTYFQPWRIVLKR